MKFKTCSFFGHRKIEWNEILEYRVTNLVKELILEHNVTTFLFGSRSNFDYVCQEIVEKLKAKYGHIKMISYTCPSEFCFLESEREKWEDVLSFSEKRKVHLVCFDEEVEHKTKYTAGKSSYIQRNQAMINASDYCIFYYNKNYQPPMRSHSKRSVVEYQPNSGTALAYKYAKQKNKIIYNLFD